MEAIRCRRVPALSSNRPHNDPETIDFPENVRRDWYEDYVNTLIARDVKNVAQIRKLDLLKDILKWILARSSKLWTTEELCSTMQISKETWYVNFEGGVS